MSFNEEQAMVIRGLMVVAAFGAGVLMHPVLTAQPAGHRVIRPARFPYMGLPYSPAILAGNTLYLAGQLGRDPATTTLVPGGIEAETRQALVNIREVLAEAGMDFRDVVNTTAYIVDYRDFDGFNKVYREFFPQDPPARATVAVAALNQGGRVELQMIAVRSR
jgi:2-iminobutanoate/2-iminopropanoate deaminase